MPWRSHHLTFFPIPRASHLPGRQNIQPICSNSLNLNMKFLGLISFLKALPICAIPKGTCLDVEFNVLNLKICCTVSGLRYAKLSSFCTGPTGVLNIKLNGLASVSSDEPQPGIFRLQSGPLSTLTYRIYNLPKGPKMYLRGQSI